MPAASQRKPSRRFSASSFAAGLIVGAAVSITSVYLLEVPGSSDSTSTGGNGVSTEDGGDQEGGPRYEFFESLPAAEVSTDTEPYKTLTPGGYVEPSKHLVQAGSFQTQDDANRLRARLMLTGMNADINISIDTRNNADEVWHRVVVGPFSSEQDAEQTMASLRKHDVSPILLQVPPAG